MKMKKWLAIFLCVAVLASMVSIIASAGTAVNSSSFCVSNIMDMLNQEALRKGSKLFEGDYLAETTGLRTARNYEKENAKRLEVTIPETGSQLNVGNNQPIDYYLTPSKATIAKTDPDTVVSTSTPMKTTDKTYAGQFVYIEYYVHDIPDNGFVQVGLGHEAAGSATGTSGEFTNTSIVEASMKYTEAGYGRLMMRAPNYMASNGAQKEIRIAFSGTQGAKVDITFVSTYYNALNDKTKTYYPNSLIRFHMPYGDNYNITLANGDNGNAGATASPLGDGNYKVPQYDNDYMVGYIYNNSTETNLSKVNEKFNNGSSDSPAGWSQSLFRYKPCEAGDWYDKEGNKVSLDSAKAFYDKNSEGITIDLYSDPSLIPEKEVGYYDFENESYTTGGNNCSATEGTPKFEIQDEDGNCYLRRYGEQGGSNANTFGFMLPNTQLTPGKNYKISFKVRATRDSKAADSGKIPFNFAVLSAKNYWTSNANTAAGGIDGNVFAADNHKVRLTEDEWTEITGYFTAKTYSDGTNALIYILDQPWHYIFDFDDIVITEAKGISFNEYGNKYSKAYIQGVNEQFPADPVRDGYVFDGWYLDKAFETPLTSETTITNFMYAYAKWNEATADMDDFAEITEAGTTDLGVKVTSAMVYPFAFTLATTGEVTVSVVTASPDDDTVAQNVVWERTFSESGRIGCLLEPNTVTVDGVTGNELYLTVSANADISDMVLGNAPKTRASATDVNGDMNSDLLDLIAFKKMAANISESNWLGDVNEDNYIANAEDLAVLKNSILGIVEDITVKGDRTLVWSDEFNGTALNSANFQNSYAGIDTNTFEYGNTEDVMSFADGKMNLSIVDYDGVKFKRAYSLSTKEKMTFKYGYLEMRAKISATPGQWASFWLSGEKVNGAAHNGEFDIFETNSLGTKLSPNVHSWDNTTGNRVAQLGTKAGSYDYSQNDFNKTEYHIFGFEWNETEIKFYIDGVCYKTLTVESFSEDYSGIFDQYYGIIIGNSAYTGSDGTTPYTLNEATPKYSIDYVRLYQKSGESLKINGVEQ